MATQSHKLFTQDGNEYREFTDAEYAQHAIDKIAYDAWIAEQAAKAVAKQAVLDRLGITADEAALLLG